MRIWELFETPFTQPGTTFIVNDPNNQTQDQPAVNTGSAIGTAKTPPTTITKPGQVPQTASPTVNTAQTNSSPENTAATLAAKQQLTKGASLNLPLGPSKMPTAMKVTDVEANNPVTKQKMVTVSNPQQPNQPQQTYTADDLAKVIANQQNRQ